MRGLRIRSGVLCSYATPGQSTAILEIGGRFLRNENWLPASSFAFGRTDSVLPRLERRKERQLGDLPSCTTEVLEADQMQIGVMIAAR